MKISSLWELRLLRATDLPDKAMSSDDVPGSVTLFHYVRWFKCLESPSFWVLCPLPLPDFMHSELSSSAMCQCTLVLFHYSWCFSCLDPLNSSQNFHIMKLLALPVYHGLISLLNKMFCMNLSRWPLLSRNRAPRVQTPPGFSVLLSYLSIIVHHGIRLLFTMLYLFSTLVPLGTVPPDPKLLPY